MFRKLLNKKKVIIGTIFVFIIFVCILATYLVVTNIEQAKCEEIRNEYQSQLELAQNQYDSELADIQKQYEMEIADIRSETKVEMRSPHNICFFKKIKSLGDGIETLVTYPYVYEMTDDVLRDTINENLETVFLDWLPEKIRLYDCALVSVEYDSNNLLSVGVTYEKLDDPFTWFDIYHTIDMRTGEILYLDDIVEVDEEFVDLLRTDGVIHPANYPCPEDASSLDKEHLLEDLQECCEPYDSNNYYRKSTFYLRNNRLYFTAIFSDIDIFYVELDDIEDKLKIEKW